MPSGAPICVHVDYARPMTAREVSDFLGLEHRGRIYDLVEMGEISCRKVGKRLYFDPLEVIRYDNDRSRRTLRGD